MNNLPRDAAEKMEQIAKSIIKLNEDRDEGNAELYETVVKTEGNQGVIMLILVADYYPMIGNIVRLLAMSGLPKPVSLGLIEQMVQFGTKMKAAMLALRKLGPDTKDLPEFQPDKFDEAMSK
jgi:hypothetical protein